MDVDQAALRELWHYFDAVALEQDKRADVRRRALSPLARAHPDAALEAMAKLCALAVDEATRRTAEARDVDPSIARMEVLRSIGRKVNGAEDDRFTVLAP